MKKFNIPFSPPDISDAEIELVADALRSGWITTGPKTKLLEKKIAEWVGTPKCVCLNSQTACAELSLRILGIGAGDEVITTAYTYTASASVICHVGAKVVMVDCQKNSLEMDYDALEAAITEKTKAVIVNSPNNPTGVVLSEDSIRRLCEILLEAEKRYEHEIFLISDEPYRELVYGGVKVPYLTSYYDNTIVCYSFSKSLSLPGERIGYLLVSPKAQNAAGVYAAVLGAGRALGFVCAPSLFQYMIPDCLGKTSDLSVYEENRKVLFEALTCYGYSVANPDGAFYLFVKALEPDAYRFCEAAKKYELLLVPSDDFGFSGYVRIAYCVTTEQIRRSLPAFRSLAAEYQSKRG